MSDSYNAQELLNKLRSKQQQQIVTQNSNKNSIQTIQNNPNPNIISSPNNVPASHNTINHQNQLIKTPVSLTLTPAQVIFILY